MKNCIIRFAKIEDYEAVERIMKQVQALHVSWRPDIYKDCDCVQSVEMFGKMVEAETFLVAELDNEVVAILSFMMRHVESAVQVTRDILFIDAMAVDEKFRRQGVGRQLFERVKEIACERECDGIELQVNARNREAFEMYRRCGFAEKSINMELV